MLQRVQTVFLFFSAISMAIFILFPLWNALGGDQEVLQLTALNLTIDKGTNTEVIPTFYLAILAALSIALSFISIFSFKNRIKQIRLNALNSLLVAIITGIIMYFIFNLEGKVSTLTSSKPALGFFMLILVVIFNRLATFFIRKDEKMVRSADRLRD